MKRVFRKIAIIIAGILLFGSSTAAMAKDTAYNEYQVDIHIKFEKNLLVNKYDVNFMIDGKTKSVMKHGKSQDFQFMLSSGKHVLTFEKKDDPSIKGRTKLNVTSKLECAYTIKGFIDKVDVTENYVDYDGELPKEQKKKEPEEQKKKEPKRTPTPTVLPYETVAFGNYGDENIEWRVLDKKDDATLLITKDIIDYRGFNDTTLATPSDWGHSTLRQWLNEDFYHSAFSDEERNAIQTTTVQDYKSEDICGEQTQDYIFILSLDQAFSYFISDQDRIAHATEYAKIRKKISSGSSISSDSYWLINSYMGDLYKYLISPKGNIDNKPRVNEYEGIRPAMWVSNNALK